MIYYTTVAQCDCCHREIVLHTGDNVLNCIVPLRNEAAKSGWTIIERRMFDKDYTALCDKCARELYDSINNQNQSQDNEK